MAGSCGSEDVVDVISGPSSDMDVERRGVGLGRSRGLILVVRGKKRKDNGRICRTCTNQTSSTSGIHEVINRDTDYIDCRTDSEENFNTVENCRNDTSVSVASDVFSLVPEEVIMEYFRRLEEDV